MPEQTWGSVGRIGGSVGGRAVEVNLAFIKIFKFFIKGCISNA